MDDAASARAVIHQRLAAAGRIHSHRGQQITQLLGAVRIERAKGTAGQTGNLLKDATGHRIAALVKHEAGHAKQAKLSRQVAQTIHILFDAIADKDQRRHLAGFALLGRVEPGPNGRAPYPR